MMTLTVRNQSKEGGGNHGHEDRDEKRGQGQASPQATQVADKARRVLTGGPAMREGEYRSPRLTAPALRAGID
jgi:hypothetical protein